jgi:hypothetical protein
MAYSAEISRGNPTCFVFMIDQSGSMSEAFGAESALRKADFVADVVNRTIHDIVIRCTRTEEIRNYYYLSVIGYGGTVGPGFGGGLAGRTIIPVSEVAEMPARLEDRTKKVPDGAGGLVETKVRFPVWMDAVSNGGTPMCQAFGAVRDLLDQWLAEHKNGFPPTVLHLTDGESTTGTPVRSVTKSCHAAQPTVRCCFSTATYRHGTRRKLNIRRKTPRCRMTSRRCFSTSPAASPIPSGDQRRKSESPREARAHAGLCLTATRFP